MVRLRLELIADRAGSISGPVTLEAGPVWCYRVFIAATSAMQPPRPCRPPSPQPKYRSTDKAPGLRTLTLGSGKPSVDPQSTLAPPRAGAAASRRLDLQSSQAKQTRVT
jgi:hypothetical protein